MEKKIGVVVAEDQELMRTALISLLNENKKITVTGEAENGKKVLDLLKNGKTDIVLMDLEMPVMNGRECLGIIRKKFPDVKVVILSMYDEEALVIDLITQGANAYLSKGCSSTVLYEAILTVYKEGAYFDRNVSKAMLSNLLRQKGINPLMDELSLSKRELEVMQELCRGKTNKEIADGFRISSSTIDFHRSNIYKKTKSKNITDLVKYAIRHKFID
jgi:DNA-binding NarL/FixJ family response regulator